MLKAIISLAVLAVICDAQILRPAGQRSRVAVPVPVVLSSPALSAADERPEPYSFSYNNADEFGTQWSRSEEGDANGVVRGSYGYRDATGLFRTVEYIADENGFRASVQSNEPGLINSAPAGVTYNIAN